MMQKWWFKLFIWFTSTATFFLGSSILISYFNPEPSMGDIMKFMSGMMDAMDNSTMGLSMTIEHDSIMKKIIGIASNITIPLIIISALSGLMIRIRRKSNDK
ncbi:hypothetical protein D2A34_26095 [Clostridium chromiireducens]|uniref:Uncharacterized protein n=1 Tax=Clostridium chromiireducens TaxID=225345 RepID=A0A399IGA5_9CLOT|nr:hypothetical protein [Clostridium chromiireducens]RII31840.1 hypothetical protein D2A34_26095 [Clostridium chromiireducens]